MKSFRPDSAFRGLSSAALLLVSNAALAVGTVANTGINNFATATYTDPAGQSRTETSNTVTVRVDEILDVTIVDGGNVSVFSPESDRALSFTVTNTGNGTEPYELSFAGVAGDNYDPNDPANNPRIFLEADGVPGFSAGDTLYTFGVNDPVLAPDGQRVVYFVSNIPAGQADGNFGRAELRGTAVTCAPNGNSAGTTFGGAGDGGTDAVAGNTTCSATDRASYVVSAVTTVLDKASAIIVRPAPNAVFGTQPVPGAIVQYTLTFTVTGTGTITGAQIVDVIPANTSFVSGSITLGGVAQSDGTDADAGRFNVNQIEVALGDITVVAGTPQTRVVTFRVTIN